ncbi:MAG: sugar ABC transporter permease [Blautia sp.]|nr:sugar ABC transporter permease [Blautia sp.]MDY3997743.1 sugar ABC transporter permease [Blautia sp.]
MFHTKKTSKLPYFLVAPVMILLLLFSYLPFPYTLYLSVNETKPITGELQFVGIKNFKRLFRNKDFWESLGNTGYYVIVTTILVIVLGVIVALILNSKIKGTSVYMSILFVPWIVSDVVAGFCWKWLLNPDFGLLNALFEPFGIRASNLLMKPQYAMLSLIMVTVWKQLAYSTILLLAGLQNVSNDLIEASKLDGCNGWQSFWRITFPIFSPILLVTVLLDMINFISQSGLALVLTGGGPLRSTTTLALYLYDEAFDNFKLTNASTISMMMALLNIVVVCLYFYTNKKSREKVD